MLDINNSITYNVNNDIIYIANSIILYKEQLYNIKSYVEDLNQVLQQLIKDAVIYYNELDNRYKKDINSLYINYNREVKLRKNIFNQLQELKGNIRVYARVRPMLESEKKQNSQSIVSFLSPEKLVLDNKKQRFAFEFERVFTHMSTQSEVFDEVQDVITSVLDGYNVCIFAYGQTGTGKVCQ